MDLLASERWDRLQSCEPAKRDTANCRQMSFKSMLLVQNALIFRELKELLVGSMYLFLSPIG